jgi:hypothetical protein
MGLEAAAATLPSGKQQYADEAYGKASWKANYVVPNPDRRWGRTWKNRERVRASEGFTPHTTCNFSDFSFPSIYSDYNRNHVATIHFVRAIPQMDRITRESVSFQQT